MIRETLRLVGVMACLAAGAQGQVQVVVPDRPSCSRCSIQLTPSLTLGDAEGPGSLSDIADATVLSDGRFAVTHGGGPDQVVVFSPRGEYLMSVGRRGRGPGEFHYALYVQGVNEQLAVTDPLLRRVTIFSKDLVPDHTVQFQGHVLHAPLFAPEGHFLLNALVRTPERVGFVMHRVERDGTIGTSFAESEGGYRFDLPEEVYFRSMALTRRGTVWIAHRTRYRIEERSVRGDRLLTVLTRLASWFLDHSGGDNRLDPATPKRPRLLDVREDSAGRLWTLTRVAARDWAAALRKVPGELHPMAQPYEYDTVDRAFDTIVEVIDPRTGRLLVAQRIDQAMGQFIGANQVLSYVTDNNGISRIRLWRIALAGI